MSRGSARTMITAAALLAAAGLTTGQASAATTTVSPSADTYVDQASPAQSFGARTSLLVNSKAGAQRNGFLRFDVGPLGGPVQSATLRLYAATSTPDAPAVSAPT